MGGHDAKANDQQVGQNPQHAGAISECSIQEQDHKAHRRGDPGGQPEDPELYIMPRKPDHAAKDQDHNMCPDHRAWSLPPVHAKGFSSPEGP